MTRGISSLAGAEVGKGHVRPFLLAEIDFSDSGIVRLNQTDRTISFSPDGGSPEYEFTGVGNLGQVTTISESSSLQALGVEMTLTGIDPAFISAAFEESHGRPGRIWLGFFDDSYRLIADPILIFKGLIDKKTIRLGEVGTVSLSLESRLIQWRRPKIRRWNHGDQISRYPGDLGFEFVASLALKELHWGVPGGGLPKAPADGPPGGFRPDPGGEGGSGTAGTGFLPDPGGGGGSGTSSSGGGGGGRGSESGPGRSSGPAAPGDTGSGGLV